MIIERRLTDRPLCEASVEVILEQSHDRIMAVTGDIDLHGCFVRTVFSFPIGSSVSLTITERSRSFSATGEVSYLLTKEGMGIRFVQLATMDSAVLQKWVDEQNPVPI
jgi:PilZ domain